VEDVANQVVKVIDTIEPDDALVTKYNERYAKFKEIYPVCKPLFDIIK
jgi:xylulokinase